MRVRCVGGIARDETGRLLLIERGQALASRCGTLLEAAELKVKQVVGDAILPFEEEDE